LTEKNYGPKLIEQLKYAMRIVLCPLVVVVNVYVAVSANAWLN
jgi:hypothetical protein